MGALRTDINREAVCASVAVKGYRQTAREFHIPHQTVESIAKAAGVRPGKAAVQIAHAQSERSDRTAAIQTPSDARPSERPAHTVVTQYALDLAQRSQLALLERNALVLEYGAKIAKSQPGKALAQTQDILGTARAAAIIQTPGFRPEGEARSAGSITSDQVASVIQRAMERIPEIEAEIVACERKLAGPTETVSTGDSQQDPK